MELGTMVTINDSIDADTASIVASEYNCKINVVSLLTAKQLDQGKPQCHKNIILYDTMLNISL